MRAHRGNLAVTGSTHRRGRNPGGVWTLSTRPYRRAHTAPFPIDIPLRAIAAGCPPGGHVLDPFSKRIRSGQGVRVAAFYPQVVPSGCLPRRHRYLSDQELRTGR
jgi:hypothetical protein